MSKIAMPELPEGQYWEVCPYQNTFDQEKRGFYVARWRKRKYWFDVNCESVRVPATEDAEENARTVRVAAETMLAKSGLNGLTGYVRNGVKY